MLLINSPVDGPWCCFHLGAIINKCVMNIVVQSQCMYICEFILV